MFFRRIHALLCIPIFCLLAGCATTQDRVSPEASSGIKRIGVMSLIGNELRREYVGMTVFGNEHENRDISDWKLDDEYEAQAGRALAAIGPFETIGLGPERRAAEVFLDIKAPQDVIEKRLKAIAERNSLDAIVVVVSRTSGDFLANSNQTFSGIGFFCRGFAVYALHITASVGVVDGHTGKLLASRMLASKQDSVLSGINAKSAPLADVEREYCRTKLGELDEEKLNATHATLIELPKAAWEPTLRALLKGPKS